MPCMTIAARDENEEHHLELYIGSMAENTMKVSMEKVTVSA